MSPSTKLAVPTVTRALADNTAYLRMARQDLARAMRRHHTAAPEAIAEAWAAVTLATDAVEDLVVQRDTLLVSLTAHELTWAHLPGDCLICTGQVRLNEDGRPF